MLAEAEHVDNDDLAELLAVVIAHTCRGFSRRTLVWSFSPNLLVICRILKAPHKWSDLFHFSLAFLLMVFVKQNKSKYVGFETQLNKPFIQKV